MQYNAVYLEWEGSRLVPSERTARVAYRRYLRNRSVRRTLRTQRTKAERALRSNSREESAEAVTKATRAMDRAVTKGVIHKNKAARLKSRLSQKFNSLNPAEAQEKT